MKTTISKLVMALTIGVVSLSTTTFACGGGGGGGGNKFGGFGVGYNKGGFGVGIGVGGNYNGNKKLYNNNHNGNCDNNGGYNGQPYGGGQAYEPYYSSYICQPGDSFYTVSLKNYGTSSVSKYIAQYNRLALNSALVPGQRLVLPSVSANGRLTQSRAPAPFVDATTQGPFTNPTAKFAPAVASTLASSVKPVATEPALPKVTVGSTLLVDGQVFGEEQGVARLRISGLSLPIEVLEWSNSSAKIRLPEVEVTSVTKAEIEVLRADGSLASKTGIELTAAETQFVLGN